MCTTTCVLASNAALVIVPDLGRGTVLSKASDDARFLAVSTLGWVGAGLLLTGAVGAACLTVGRETDGTREGRAVLACTGGVEPARVVAREMGARTVD